MATRRRQQVAYAPFTQMPEVPENLPPEEQNRLLREALATQQEAHEQYLQRLARIGRRHANRNNWCGTYDDIAKQMGLPPGILKYDAEFSLIIPVMVEGVEAENPSDALAKVTREQVMEAAKALGVNLDAFEDNATLSGRKLAYSNYNTTPQGGLDSMD